MLRVALLIGVSDYGYDPGWSDLHAGNDVALLAEALGPLGFSRVDLLRDGDATREGILAALATLAEAVHPGDHVLVHYSGHGQQIRDDDGDEMDGFDEALVAYGAPMRSVDGYAGERHLRDDDVGEALNTLRQRLGPTGSLVVSLDSCHSGTATRGDFGVRGGAPPIGEGTATPRDGSAPPVAARRGSDFAEASSGSDWSPVVYLSAARSDQLAREGRGPDGAPAGAFTVALVSALTDPRPQRSWTDVYERVRAAMAETASGQTPQLEGNGDLSVFGALLEAPAAYLAVKEVRDRRTVVLAAGALRGVNVGSKVELHPAGSASRTPIPLAVGEIVEARATASTLLLSADSPSDDLLSARAFVTSYAESDHRLGVGLDLPAPAREEWKGWVEAHPLLRLSKQPDFWLQEDEQVVLVASSSRDAPLARGAERVRERLGRIAHAHLVRQVRLAGPNHAVAVDMVPANEMSAACSPPSQGDCDPQAHWVKVGVAFQVRVTHRGTLPSFLTLVYVDARGDATQLWPPPHQAPEALPVGGSWVLPRCLAGTEPSDGDALLVFATREPLDLGPVLGYAPSDVRGGALQALLDSAASGTRAAHAADTLLDGYTATLTYEVVPR